MSRTKLPRKLGVSGGEKVRAVRAFSPPERVFGYFLHGQKVTSPSQYAEFTALVMSRMISDISGCSFIIFSTRLMELITLV